MTKIDGPEAKRGGPFPLPRARRANVTALLEEHYPGSTFVIVPHTGFGNLVPALSQVNADLEPKMAGWPKPSLALVKDNWIGAIEAPAVPIKRAGSFLLDQAWSSTTSIRAT